ncbi:MAG TPA: glycosyltransferase [Cytophagaceae bacterium]|jgi:glycosyltransferase involved in cell wall biosynthesis
MDVSVIIPAYNAKQFIYESVSSALDSKGVAVEVIVVDDGSTDGTVEELSKIINHRLIIIQTKNKGVASARNTGLMEAKGNYIAFLDADDVFEPENLEAKVRYLETFGGTSLVYSSVSIFDGESGDELEIKRGRADIKLKDFLEFNRGGVYCPSSVLITREALLHAGNFDISLATAADLDLWIRLAKHGSIGYIDKPLVKYRVHPGQMHFNIPLMERDNLLIFKKYSWPYYYRDKSHYNFCLSKFLLILSLNYAGHTNHFHKAAVHLFRSLFLSPIPSIDYLKAKMWPKCAE